MADRQAQPSHSREQRFDTTQWSVVLRAADSSAPEFDAALASLCEIYWVPLYAFLRKSGRTPSDASDLTQAFFAYLIEKRIHSRANPDRGRFRTFLLAALKRFLSSERERAARQKRGGGARHLSLDVETAEERYGRDLVQDFSPEQMFDRQWANLLFDEVVADMKRQYAEAGEIERFDALKSSMMALEDSAPYAELAPRLGLTEDGVKSAARRLRRRFRELFRERLARLVDNPADVDDEIRRLIEAMG